MKLEWRMCNIYKCYLWECGMISLSRILFQMCSKMLYVVCRDVDCWGSRRQVCNNESKMPMMKWWWWIRDVVDDDESEMLLMMMNQRDRMDTDVVGLGMSNFSFVCFVHCWSRRFAVWNLVLETLSLWDLVWAILYLCVFCCVLCIVGAKVAGWFSRVVVDAGVWRSWLSPSTFSSPPNSWILLMVCPASQSHNLISVHLICCTVETLGCSRLLQFCF